MTKTVGVAEAKAHLSQLMAEAAYGGMRILIERRGKPLAALVSVADLTELERGNQPENWPHDVIKSLNAWHEMGDDAIDEMVEDIYNLRHCEMGRPVNLED